MADEDLASIVVYIRSLPPIRNSLPKTEIIFPVKYLIRNAPQPLAAPVPPPDLSSPLKRGEYLVRMAGCTTCHTPQQCGQSKCGHGVRRRPPLQWPSVHRYRRQHHSGSFRYSRLRREPISAGDANRKSPGSRPQPGDAVRRLSKYDRRGLNGNLGVFACDSAGSSSCGQFLTSDGMQTLSGKTRRRRSELTV